MRRRQSAVLGAGKSQHPDACSLDSRQPEEVAQPDRARGLPDGLDQEQETWNMAPNPA